MPVPYGQKPDLSMIKVFGAVIIIILLRVMSPFVTAMFQNILIQTEIQQAFDEIDHPAGTAMIQYQETFGALRGISKQCDFFAGQLRTYNGPQDVLLADYEDLRYKDVGDYQVILLEKGQIPEISQGLLPVGVKNTADWELPEDPDAQQYILFLFLVNYGESRDLRCK